MRKLAAAVLCLTPAGCASASSDPEATSPSRSASSPTSSTVTQTPSGPEFTNLGDEESLATVTEALAQAGVPQADIDTFAEQVRSLTAVVPEGALVTAAVPLSAATEDDGTVATATDRQPRLTNCRITVFTLMHSLVSVGATDSADTSMLFVDTEQLDTSPELFASQRGKFDVLYGRILTTKEKDPAARIADVRTYLADHGVTYAPGKASVISVYVHDTLDAQTFSFVGYTGVLVETGDGLLFIEKLAFDAPYRAIRFDSRAELNDYLLSMYDDGPDMDYGSPLIFENGDPLKV